MSRSRRCDLTQPALLLTLTHSSLLCLPTPSSVCGEIMVQGNAAYRDLFLLPGPLISLQSTEKVFLFPNSDPPLGDGDFGEDKTLKAGSRWQ